MCPWLEWKCLYNNDDWGGGGGGGGGGVGGVVGVGDCVDELVSELSVPVSDAALLDVDVDEDGLCG